MGSFFPIIQNTGRSKTGNRWFSCEVTSKHHQGVERPRKESVSMTYQPIENYGMVGDLHTVALVGMDGSIDFMAFPHFDSPTIFAALLDHRHGGRFHIAPVLGKARQKQIYLSDSNILISRFLSEDGVAEVSDF